MAAKKKTAKVAARGKAAVKKVAQKVTKKKALPIPRGYHTLTPSLVVNGAAEAMEFYKRAFGAKQKGGAMTGPDGKIMHAEMQIGDSVIMLSDESPQMGSKGPKTLGGSPSSILIYVRDVDAAFQKAVSAGAMVQMPLADQFWGDRYGRLQDPFGHSWELATHKEDLSPKEMMKRMQAMMSQGGPQA